jgi:phage terminase small subunit
VAKKLTAKQAVFVKEYLIDMNASAAAIRAGFAPNNASVIGHQLLRKTLVAEKIAEAQAERAQKCEIDALWVLKEAKRTYEFAHELENPSAAVAALKLVGTHVDIQAFKERTASEISGINGNPIKIIERRIVDTAN